jgi:hypothetical protein
MPAIPAAAYRGATEERENSVANVPTSATTSRAYVQMLLGVQIPCKILRLSWNASTRSFFHTTGDFAGTSKQLNVDKKCSAVLALLGRIRQSVH